MTTKRCEFGLWELTQSSSGTLRIAFSAPTESRLTFERKARFALKLGYALLVAYICFSNWSGFNSILVFATLMLIIPFASAVRRGQGGDNRFMPFLLTIDRHRQVIEMTDPRGRPATTRTVDVGDVQAVFLDRRIGKYAPPARIAIQFNGGEKVWLPAHGLDADLVLEPIYSHLPQTVSRDPAASE
jgi:hypothetical protein